MDHSWMPSAVKRYQTDQHFLDGLTPIHATIHDFMELMVYES